MNSITAAEHATEARPMRGSASSVLLDEPDIPRLASHKRTHALCWRNFVNSKSARGNAKT